MANREIGQEGRLAHTKNTLEAPHAGIRCAPYEWKRSQARIDAMPEEPVARPQTTVTLSIGFLSRSGPVEESCGVNVDANQ